MPYQYAMNGQQVTQSKERYKEEVWKLFTVLVVWKFRIVKCREIYMVGFKIRVISAHINQKILMEPHRPRT